VRIVLTIHHALDLDSGAPGITMLLAEALTDRGHDVSLVSFDDLPSVDERVRALLFPLYIARLSRRSDWSEVDIVDASTGDAWLWSLWRSPEAPGLVTRSHGLEHVVHEALMGEVRRGKMSVSRRYGLYHGGVRLRQVAVSLRRADAVAFLNTDERSYAIDRLGVDASRAVVIPHGLPEAVSGQTLATNGAHPVRIAQIGSYQWRKGVMYAHDALTSSLREHPMVRVLLLGTGAPSNEVLAGFPEDVREQIQVMPSYERSQLPRLLEGFQIALFPSLAEGFPLGLVESMACGLAPIATTIPGPRDIVRDGIDGLMVPPADTRALTDAIDRLLNNPELLYRLRAGALARAQGYTWSRTLDATEALYRTVVDRRALEARH
jgi:glycosyltransferase involved in cell wall biosynthesis